MASVRWLKPPHCTATWCDKAMSSTTPYLQWCNAMAFSSWFTLPTIHFILSPSDLNAVDGAHFSPFFLCSTRTDVENSDSLLHKYCILYTACVWYAIPHWHIVHIRTHDLSLSLSLILRCLNCHITIKYQIFQWSSSLLLPTFDAVARSLRWMLQFLHAT